MTSFIRPSSKVTLHRKHVLQAYVSSELFRRYVATVSYGCCKSRSVCCI
jgi:hypothetical protein